MAKREANIIVRLRDEATAGFKRLGGAVNAVLKPLSLATAALTGLAAAGGGLFLRSAIRTAGEFGEQMSILQGLTGAAAEELRALEDAAREAGATTRFTATEAGQGLEELIRGGQRSTEAIQSLNAALSLAAGNNQTVAESAQQMITALNAFGLEADSAGRVADVYTRAAQRSAQTTQELAEAMSYAAPVARGAGLDIEQTAALTGALADQGFRGSRAGTALANALIEMRNPAGRFRQELAELGIESTDFIEVLEELEQRGPAAEAALLALGKRSGPAIQALLQGGTGSVRNLTVELRNAEGAADEAAAAMENNLPGALRALRSAFADLQIEAVKDLTDGLKDSVFDLAQSMRDFTSSPAMTSLKGLLTDTFGAGLEAVQNFIAGIDLDKAARSFARFADDAAEKVRAFGESTHVLKNGFRQTVGGIQILIGTARASYNALGVVIGSVITVATAGMSTLLKAFDRATLGLNRWISGITSELDHLQASFAESTQGFAEGFGRSIDQIGAGWDRLAGITKEGAARVADAAEEALGGAAETAEEYTERLKRALMDTGLTAEQVGLHVETLTQAIAEGQNEAADAIERTRAILERFGVAMEETAAESGRSVQAITGDLLQLAQDGEASLEQLAAAADNATTAFNSDQLAEYNDKLRELMTTGQLTLDQFLALTRITADVGSAGKNTAEEFERLSKAVEEASSGHELSNLTAEVQRLAEEGGLAREEVEALISAIRAKQRAQQDADQDQRTSTQAMGDGTKAVQEYGKATKEAEGRAVRLGGAIHMAAEAQALFNERISEWAGGGSAQYIQFWKRSLQEALEVNERINEAQARLNRLQDQGIDVTQASEAANHELRMELLRLNGEKERAAEIEEQARRKALEAQIDLARAQGDEEQVRLLLERKQLIEQISRAEERQARQREQERQREDNHQRDQGQHGAAGSAGGRRIQIDLVSRGGSDGAPRMNTQDLQTIADRVLQQIQADMRRTGHTGH